MSSNKPVIGIVSWDFVQAKGGMGRSMQWMATAVSQDYRVLVGTPLSGLLPFTKRCGGHLLFSLCLPFVLNQWIKKNKVDLLLIPGGPGGVFLWKKPSIPYVCSVYHIYEQQARLVPWQWWKRIFIPLERSTYRGAVSILSFNTDTRRILEERYKIPAHRIQSLPHAVSDAWKAPLLHSKKKRFCVCVARLEARKGVELLVDAWSKVIENIPDARLLIVGQGMRAEAIDRKIAKTFGIVRIPALLFPDLVSVVQQAEVAVCPAYLEGFGLAAAEAMMAGTAVVSANSEGLRCFFERAGTGFLFESGSREACADRLIEVLKNDDVREQVAANAKKQAEYLFDETVASERLRDALKEMMTNG